MTWPEKGPKRESAKELVVLLTNDNYIQHSPWSETSDFPPFRRDSKNCDCNSVLHNSLALEFNMYSLYSVLRTTKCVVCDRHERTSVLPYSGTLLSVIILRHSTRAYSF